MSGIPPVNPVENSEHERKSPEMMKNIFPKPTDKKIQRLILVKIQDSFPLLLFVSVVEQDIVANFVSHVCHPKKTVQWRGNNIGFRQKLKNESHEKLSSLRP